MHIVLSIPTRAINRILSIVAKFKLENRIRITTLIDQDAWQLFSNYYASRKVKLLIYSCLVAFQSVLLLPILILTKEVFDSAIPNSDIRMIVWIGVAIVLIRLLSSALELLIRKRIVATLKSAVKEMRQDIISKLYTLSHAFYSNSETGVLHSRVVGDSQRVDALSMEIFSKLVPAAVTSVPLLVLMIYLHPQLTTIILAISPIIYISNLITGKYLKRVVKSFQRAYEGFNKGVLFVLENMALTRIQSCEVEELQRQSRFLETLRHNTEKMVFAFGLHSQIQNNIVGISSILILTVGAASISTGNMTIGAFVAFYGAAALLNSKVKIILNGIPAVITGIESLKTLNNLLNNTEQEPYTGRHKLNFDGAISFKNVQFDYNGENLIKNINLEIGAQSNIVIIGKNGQGKSTIINLLLGFYRPHSGSISAAGRSYDEISMHELRKSVGVVPQQSTLFNGSIFENISYGNGVVGPEEVYLAAKYSLAHEFIEKLPDKYDTEVGVHGSKLSGGEIQKIAIARVLLRKPKLLIFDEPTNHLDMDSIKMLLDSLKTVPESPGMLMISHEAAVINFADQVYQLESGILHKLQS